MSSFRPPPLPSDSIDAARAAGAVAVVWLHAAVAYAQPAMPGLVWPVHDDPSSLATGLMWATKLFVMPWFLAIAGFLTARSLSQTSATQYLPRRLRRLLVPMAIAAVVLLPIELYTWLGGWLIEGRIEPRKIQSLKLSPEQSEGLFGTAHLWFLLYVATYTVPVALARRWCRPSRRGGWVWIAGGLAASSIAIGIEPTTVWGFQHAWWPVPTKWAYCGGMFAVGIGWFGVDPAMNLARGGRPKLTAIAAGFAAAVLTIPAISSTPATPVAAVLIVAASMSWSGHLARAIPAIVVPIASASMLVYLLHHPVVALAHVTMRVVGPAGWPILKMTVVAAAGLFIPMAIAWLRQPKQTSEVATIPFPAVPSPAITMSEAKPASRAA